MSIKFRVLGGGGAFGVFGGGVLLGYIFDGCSTNLCQEIRVGIPWPCYRGPTLGPPGPKLEKESRKVSSRTLSAPGPKQSQTESKKSQNSWKTSTVCILGAL